MKSSRFQWAYRESASSLHRAVGETLRNSTMFSNYQIYQEYPVNRVSPDYPESSHHFDWVVMDVFVVIECHGKQHYEAVDFSGKAEDGGIGALQSTRRRDNKKKQAAIEAGFTYIEIPYTDEKLITEEYIWGLYQENLNETELRRDQPIQEEDPYHTRRLEAAREYRKQAYRRAKERMEVRSRGKTKPSFQGKGTSKD
jgi:hypothetical protein